MVHSASNKSQLNMSYGKIDFLTRPAVNIAVKKIDIKRVRYHYSRDRITIVWSLWRHQQSIVTSSTERKPSEWDTGKMCKADRFYSHLWIRYVVMSLCVRNKIIYVLSWRTRTRNTKITLSWALKRFVTWVHSLFSIYNFCHEVYMKTRNGITKLFVVWREYIKPFHFRENYRINFVTYTSIPVIFDQKCLRHSSSIYQALLLQYKTIT